MTLIPDKVTCESREIDFDFQRKNRREFQSISKHSVRTSSLLQISAVPCMLCFILELSEKHGECVLRAPAFHQTREVLVSMDEPGVVKVPGRARAAWSSNELKLDIGSAC